MVAVDEQQKLVKKSLEIQVEERHVAEIKNKVQTVKNSLEVTDRSIKQTQMTSVNGYRGDECQYHACAEKTKSSESKRKWRLVRALKLTRGPGEERNTETRMRRTRRRSKSRRTRRSNAYSEKHLHEGKLKDKSPRRQVYVEAHHEEVEDSAFRGRGNFEWNTDLIEQKLENWTCQVAQDLYSGDAQHEPRAHEAQHCRSLHETLGTQSLARKREPRILDGTNGDD